MSAFRRLALTLVCLAMPVALLGVPHGASAFDRHPTRFAGEPVDMGQTNGPVWALEVIGDRLYAAGEFRSTRGSGDARGEEETRQSFLAAFDGRSGEPLPGFAPAISRDGSKRSVAVLAMQKSPDEATLYVGGDFTDIGSDAVHYLAALDPVSGARKGPLGDVGVEGQVTAMALSPDGSTLYVGGDFYHSGDEWRKGLAAFDTDSGALLEWAPQPSDAVRDEAMAITSLEVSEDGETVFIGGTFRRMNRKRAQGFAGVSATTGEVRARYSQDRVARTSWATSIAVSRGAVFFTTRDDLSGKDTRTEGVFSVDSGTGRLKWYSQCFGDAFAVLPLGDEVYVGSHAHDCAPAGGMPDHWPRVYLGMHVVSRATGMVRPHFVQTGGGTSDTQLSSRALALVSGHLVMGGGFSDVNGQPQDNLTRFPVGSAAPADPGSVRPSTCAGCGKVRIKVSEGFDRDDITLTYRVYRNRNTKRPIKKVTRRSVLWEDDVFTFVDRRVRKGKRVSYRVKTTDPHGNSTWSKRSRTVTVGRP